MCVFSFSTTKMSFLFFFFFLTCTVSSKQCAIILLFVSLYVLCLFSLVFPLCVYLFEAIVTMCICVVLLMFHISLITFKLWIYSFDQISNFFQPLALHFLKCFPTIFSSSVIPSVQTVQHVRLSHSSLILSAHLDNF